MTDTTDASAGYEGVAAEFMDLRATSRIGAGAIEEWAAGLPARSAVLDLGCGHGVPVTEVLLHAGHRVWGVDASPALVEAFRRRFPEAEVECAPVQHSAFFGRSFQGVVAWGLLFLLSPGDQASLIRRVSRLLPPGGEFLFTAPHQDGEWEDRLTGGRSVSLGRETYRALLEGSGMTVLREGEDEGGNHHVLAARTA